MTFVFSIILLLQGYFYLKKRSLPLLISVIFTLILLLGTVFQVEAITDLTDARNSGFLVSSIYILLGVLHKKLANR